MLGFVVSRKLVEWIGEQFRPPRWLADSGRSVVSVHSTVLFLQTFDLKDLSLVRVWIKESHYYLF